MTNKYFLLTAVFTFGLLSLTSCGKDEDINVVSEDYTGIFVVNEGGFNKSNGSIGLYKPGTKTYFDAFKKANDRPLGDVVQSMSLLNNKFYVVVNNSNKIEVLNKNDFKALTSISTPSPRYLVNIGGNKALLSNLYNNTMKVIDLNSNTIASSIDIHHSSDAMAVMGNKTYVLTLDDKIMLVKNDSLYLKDSIATPAGLSKIVNAGTSAVGVLCAGKIDWSSGNVLENGTFVILSNDSNSFTKRVDLSGAGYGGSLTYNSSEAVFYYSLGNNLVKKIDMSGNVSDFITLPTNVSVYGLNMDNAGNLYITDAVDYNSAGKVYVYNSMGTKTNEFSAGIVPSSILVNE